MNTYKKLITDAKKYISILMANNDPSHDYSHVERVYNNAIYIARQERYKDPSIYVDYTVLALAALFHDVADFKYIQNDCLEDVARSRLIDFCNSYKYTIDAEKISHILHIVLNVSFRKELEEKPGTQHSIEFKIVRDADRLEAMGAIGIGRCFGYSCVKQTPFYQADVKPVLNISADEYNKKTTGCKATSAYNHFYEKLLLLKDKMLTDTGKKMAEPRHSFMLLFLDQMMNEMNVK
jgi:uncharacterized protein